MRTKNKEQKTKKQKNKKRKRNKKDDLSHFLFLSVYCKDG